jgi:glycosyltransferase involved in cell wall biosynthesis
MESPGSVLIVVENLPVPFDRRVWMEATTLADAGYKVTVISRKAPGYIYDQEVLDGIVVYRHELPVEGDSAPTYLFEYARALWGEILLARRIYRYRPFDVIHLCNPPDLLFVIAAWFKLRNRVRVIFDHHDLNPELYEAKYGRRDLFYRLLLLAERLTFLTADVVITTGESYREVALSRGHKRLEDVFIVRSAPNLARFQPVPPDEKYKKGRRYLVGYVGVMGPQEGLDYLLHAARRIVDAGRTDVSFVLIGDGPSAHDLKALALDLGLADYVEFPGRVPDEDLIARLSTCDLCVNPDPYNPFNDASVMNKILEYMALGRPVVQFDLTEGRRSAGDASAYARRNDADDLARAIVELLDDEPRRRKMGDEGYRRMHDELEWRHQIPKLLEAYKRALGKRPKKFPFGGRRPPGMAT